ARPMPWAAPVTIATRLFVLRICTPFGKLCLALETPRHHRRISAHIQTGGTMSNANVSQIQSLYAAFGRGDIAPIIAALAPDVDWPVSGRREHYPPIGSRP